MQVIDTFSQKKGNCYLKLKKLQLIEILTKKL